MHVRVGRRLLIAALVVLARVVLRRYRPRVVVVTGSVGKTTTKDLVAAALGSAMRVYATRGTENNEVGVPAAVLGCVPGRTVMGWARVLARGAVLALGRRRYPAVLVLEVAAGRPGEIERITRYLRPDVAVVTNVRGVHLEHFRTLEAVAREKGWVVQRLCPGGVAVLNADDPAVLAMRALAPGRVLTYGFAASASVRVVDLELGIEGCTGTLCIDGASAPEGVPTRLRLTVRLLGAHQVASVAAAAATAGVLGVPAAQALAAIARVEPPAGRLRAVRPRPGLIVLDDSYNASPQAVLDAVEVLTRFPGPRRAVLGDMRELGPASARSHREVGQALPGRIDGLVTVGREAALIAEAAVAHGMESGRVVAVQGWQEATRALLAEELDGTVLVKGSRAVRLDEVVRALCEAAGAAGADAHPVVPDRGPGSRQPAGLAAPCRQERGQPQRGHRHPP